MIIVKYSVTFTAIGDFALQLLRTRGSLIIFDKGVPLAYENMVLIAEREYSVARLGSDANKNLREHGHVTLRFAENDDGEELQPGDVLLMGERFPRIMVGDLLEIL